MGGRAFEEDPELLQALGRGGGSVRAPEFQEDPELLQHLSQPRGASVPFVEPDPNMEGRYPDEPGDSNFQRGMREARAYDLMVNDGVGETERMAEAASGLMLPGARAGGSYLGNMARNAASGGLQGGLAAYRDSGNVLDGLLGAGRGALMSAGLTGAGTAVGAAGSKIAGAADDLANWFGGHADEARILATGKPAPDVEALGPQGRAELAGNIEREGLHSPINWFDNGTPPPMPGSFRPAGPKTYARNADALANRGEATMRGAEDQINQLPQPPQVPISGLINANRARADQTAGLAHPANPGVAQFRNDLIDRLESDSIRPGQGPTATMAPAGWNGHEFMQPGGTVDLPSGELPWARALEQRRNIDQNVNWQAQGANEPWNNATGKQVGNELRGEIDSALNTPNVPPELAQQWRTGRDQTALGLGVRDDARASLGQQPPPRLPTSPTQFAQTLAGPAVRYGGYSAMAGAARGAQGFARGIEGVVGENAEALTGVSQRGGAAAGSALSQNDSIKSWFAQKGVDFDNVIGQGRGNQLGTAAIELLQTNPGALGQYQQQIAEAAQNGPQAVNQLLSKLEEDANFRTGPLVQLRQMTGGQ